jgi:hypothetical protein
MDPVHTAHRARLRQSRAYCEIFPHDVSAKELERRGVVGVILSGGRERLKDLPLLLAGEQFGLMTSAQRMPALHLAAFTFAGATRY